MLYVAAQEPAAEMPVETGLLVLARTRYQTMRPRLWKVGL